MSNFFKRHYRKALELFEYRAQLRYNCHELTITKNQVFAYLEDLFRDELILKDEDQELFVSSENNCMKVRIY